MKPLRTNYYTLIITVFLAILVGGAYLYLYHQIQRNFAKAKAAQSVILLQKSNNVEAENTVALYQKTTAERDKLSSFFISDSDTVTFIETMENIGPRVGSNVTLSSVTADDTANIKAGSYGKLSARVDVTGNWTAVMRTLMLSEVLPYQSYIDNIGLSLSQAADKKSSALWHLSFAITSTMLPNQKK